MLESCQERIEGKSLANRMESESIPQATENTLLGQQPIRKKSYKPTKTLKPPAIQSAILAKRASGSSKAKIAKELGMAVNTVTNVLELNDFDRSLEVEQRTSLALIPRAIQVAHDRLSKGSENMAIKVLENTIWPLNAKTSKQQDAGLTLAIQNLMGNVTVGNAQPVENKAIEAQVVVSTGTIAPPNNSATSAQVIENKESAS
jgi:hypothetical protein